MSTTASLSPNVPWYKQLTGYHWFVLIVASAAWFFDCLDQRLFSLARVPALLELMNLKPGDPALSVAGKWVTAFFLVGWGIGGMIFGALGDKYGRARMLTLTILIYSAFTGLSFFSRSQWDFTLFRFLTGVGVGGVFGLAVALIAETVPQGARAQSLGLLQILSTIGNLSAGFAKKIIDGMEQAHTITPGSGWRWMFLIGAVPAVMIVFTRGYLKEPATWLRLKEQDLLPKGSIFAPYGKLLASRRWRKNLIVGAFIASTGVVGLWAIGEYAVDLQPLVFKQYYQAQGGMTPDEIGLTVKANIADTYLWNMIGAAVGMTIFTWLAKLGRKLAFFLGFTAAMVITALVYMNLGNPHQAGWMMFLMGAAQLSVFAGFAIYLPELFPSELRSTGTSFCYNLGRFAAAIGSFFSAQLTAAYSHYAATDPSLPARYAAVTMCAVFLVGIATLLFSPETKGQPLPEDT